MSELRHQPHAQRRGRLKNGNPPGDFMKAARCGARTRRGTACLGPAMGDRSGPVRVLRRTWGRIEQTLRQTRGRLSVQRRSKQRVLGLRTVSSDRTAHARTNVFGNVD